MAALVSPLLFACGDSGVTTDSPTNPSTPTNPSGVDTLTGSMTTSGQPATEPGTPTTGDEGGNSQGTDPGTTTNSPSDPSTTVDTTTTMSSDPSTSSATDGTTSTTDASTTDVSGTDGSSSGGPPPPMCTEAECPMGQFCNMQSGLCEPGCNDDTDCNDATLCDVGEKVCKGCLIDGNCGLGTVCEGGTCVAGCNDMQPCQDGLACCGGQCFDVASDPLHCGGCTACPLPDNAAASCVGGTCGLGACQNDFNNCDKDPGNGCEVDGSCECVPGEKVACYTGPEETKNIGVCKGGLQTCNAQGTGYGSCTGEVLPGALDLCANSLDDDCDGSVDEDPDEDGDGWTVCGGDCCDAIGPNCLNPLLVNPGAFEQGGNMVDDDCDGMKDNAVPVCDAGLASDSNVATDYAKAIDLCKFTTENPPQKMKTWGVISANLFRASGADAPDPSAKSIRTGFGTNVKPQQNSSLAVFSTGFAADKNDTKPAFAPFEPGINLNSDSTPPADWLAANGNKFPNAPGCPAALSNAANDSIMLKVRVRVPTNAKSFSVQMYFYSAEWPEWTCTPYNDMFVTLLNSQGAGNPADKNIAIYTTPNNLKYPVGVNLVKAASGLFTQCKNGQYGCSGNQVANYNGCTSVAGLAGTGFDDIGTSCAGNNTVGGGTGWLKMAGNVKGGETMEIRFVIWDTSDSALDSLVLLDDWTWSVQASQPGVQPN
ncbi:MAG TPA: choice-of-anchor L domain-containing protein [Nannocystis sp.]